MLFVLRGMMASYAAWKGLHFVVVVVGIAHGRKQIFNVNPRLKNVILSIVYSDVMLLTRNEVKLSHVSH